MIKKPIGGERIGSGNKMQVEMHGYERSNQNLTHKFINTQSPGTVVPFLKTIGLPGDTFDIDLNALVMTHPTVGPLFGRFILDAHVFIAPIRLYQPKLQNNNLKTGLEIETVLFPTYKLQAARTSYRDALETGKQEAVLNSQVNKSSIFSYLGVKGIGGTGDTMDEGNFEREFNALPWLGYWDIIKNYYANKQETDAYVIHSPRPIINETVVAVALLRGATEPVTIAIPNYDEPTQFGIEIIKDDIVRFQGTDPAPDFATLVIKEQFTPNYWPIKDLFDEIILNDSGPNWQIACKGFKKVNLGGGTPGTPFMIQGWGYIKPGQLQVTPPQMTGFPLENIDIIRNFIMATATGVGKYELTNQSMAPYGLALEITEQGLTAATQTQEGLAIKCYESDRNTAWLKTEFIDQINEQTGVDTTSGSFTIDQLNIANKLFNLKNRVAMSGGSYDDWIETVYDHKVYRQITTPVYCGGLRQYIDFQEVVSTAATNTSENGGQPLGQLAGKGRSGHQKGGNITIKVDEPSYILGMVSITPEVVYSEGNHWDADLKNLDQLHKPELDEIGFQDLISEWLMWNTTTLDPAQVITKYKVGYQPAWTNYMTEVDEAFGNFAIQSNEMFMTLNRRYTGGPSYVDATAYIDPVLYNHIFAETSLDAMNFWVQIHKGIHKRTKMSNKVMPRI